MTGLLGRAWGLVPTIAWLVVGCGDGELGLVRYHSPRLKAPDGGDQWTQYPGPGVAACVDKPLALEVSIALDDKGSLSDLDIGFRHGYRDANGLGPALPPQETLDAGANADFLASLLSADGTALSAVYFRGPQPGLYNDLGATFRVVLILPLVPGATTLEVKNQASGEVIIDLDLRGHLQLLCIDQPCLSLCQTPDGGAAGPAVDAGGPGS